MATESMSQETGGKKVETNSKKKASSHLNDIMNREAVKSEETTLKFEVLTEVYDSEKLNDALLGQLKGVNQIDLENENQIDIEDMNKINLNDVTPDAPQVQNETNDQPEIFNIPSGLKPPFAHLNLVKEMVDDEDDVDFNQRLSEFDTVLYPCYEAAISIDTDFRVPECIWTNLLRYEFFVDSYQRTGLHWLQSLYKQNVGGILSDEMGLGKTVQVVSFLGSLHFNCKNNDKKFGLALIIVPMTLMKLWLHEIYCWWPYFRVIILHHSCSNHKSGFELLEKHSNDDGVIVISTYNTVLKNQEHMAPFDWNYVILDEGHKIKNPSSNISLLAIQFKTPRRLIVSGTPIQNNLKELWTLMNFVYPGLLGGMDLFMKNVATHITKGSFKNSTILQVKTGFTCAKMLKNLIEPYLLRRTKKQVQSETKLPEKSDLVLFCHLTEEQSDLYVDTLNTPWFTNLRKGNRENCNILKGVTILRKICNHPHLVDKDSEFKWRSSSKIVVVHSLLEEWKPEGHKVLLYSQSVKMLNILETFCKFNNFTYRRMDGKTPLNQRQELIDTFNTDQNIFIFLLSTKVGGIGISLTGADRVIIYDPDWNPTNDTQAKERVWRIGQTKDVKIYRIVTSGTIEEKIYNRQIFKQFVANKVLVNPAHAGMKLDFGDINALFSYHKPLKIKPEISITENKYSNVPEKSKPKKRKYKWRKEEDIPSDDEVTPTMIDYKKYVERIREIDGSNTGLTDIKIIEAKAEEIAASAINSLKVESVEKLSDSRAKPGLDILQKLSSPGKVDHSNKDVFNDKNSSEIASSLRKFLISKRGRATSREILTRFRKHLSNEVARRAFEKILKKMADLTKNNSDSGIKVYWRLKRKFYPGI